MNEQFLFDYFGLPLLLWFALALLLVLRVLQQFVKNIRLSEI